MIDAATDDDAILQPCWSALRVLQLKVWLIEQLVPVHCITYILIRYARCDDCHTDRHTSQHLATLDLLYHDSIDVSDLPPSHVLMQDSSHEHRHAQAAIGTADRRAQPGVSGFVGYRTDIRISASRRAIQLTAIYIGALVLSRRATISITLLTPLSHINMLRNAGLRLSQASTSRAGARAFSSTPARRLMDTTCLTESQKDVREAVASLAANYPDSYWRDCDKNSKYPFEFQKALADGGWLGVALPEKFGGSGLGVSEAAIMMQTITESGAGLPGAQSSHANVYATQPLSIFGTDEQRAKFIPKIVAGEWRTCFGVTEPNVGLNTLELKTTATRLDDGRWSISGQKTWITNGQNAAVMILLARTKALEDCVKKSEGLTLFVIPIDKNADGLDMSPIPKMGGKAVDSNEVWFDNYIVPADSVVGGDAQIGKGFKMILHGMNTERILIGAEAIGIGYAALKKAAKYAAERVVFNRPIGANQGVAHPLADAYMQLHAATLAVYHAARIYDQSQTDKSIPLEAVGAAANSAKYLGAEACFTATTRSIMAHGGMGFAQEFDVERFHRESFVPRLAPISPEMIKNYISERVLGLPKSY